MGANQLAIYGALTVPEACVLTAKLSLSVLNRIQILLFPCLYLSAPTQVKRRPLSAVGYKRPISQYAQMAVATATGAPCRYQVSAQTFTRTVGRKVQHSERCLIVTLCCLFPCSQPLSSQRNVNIITVFNRRKEEGCRPSRLYKLISVAPTAALQYQQPRCAVY